MYTMEGTPVNPLSNPKGVKLVCELCAKPAYIQCKNCHVTYYCDAEHQELDYKGIHSKICVMAIPLKTPVAVLGSEEERAIRDTEMRNLQMHLLQLSKTEAHKLLFEGQHDLAIPAALQSLRFSMDVYGHSSIDLVPSYLLLGEASIGLKQYTQAEDYLSLAKWAIVKAEHCEPSVRAQLYRNFGLLYASQGLFQKALYQLAMDVYYSSLATSPDHISVTGGYFQIGSVFERQNRLDDASAAFDTVISVWRKRIRLQQQPSAVPTAPNPAHPQQQQSPTGSTPQTPSTPGVTLASKLSLGLDDAQIAEAIQMLSAIYAFRIHYGSSAVAAGDVLLVLGQVYGAAGTTDKAKELTTRALEVYEAALGREHSSTIEARSYLRAAMQADAPATRKLGSMVV